MAINIPVKDIARELYKGNIEKFSKGALDEKQANDIIMQRILEVCDCTEKFSEYKFKQNIQLVYEIISEAIAEPVRDGVVSQYNEWVDVDTVDYNVTKEWNLPNNNLFKVGVVAEGTTDFDRQRLLRNKISASGFNVGLSIYDEFHNVRTGKTDFVEMIDKVRESIDTQIMQIIVNMIEESYTGLGALGVTGVYSDEKMIKLCQAVKGISRVQNVTIYGTLSAINNLTGVSEADKNDNREYGHVRKWKGMDVVEIPQVFNAEKNPIVSENILYIMPSNIKIIKLAFEGEPVVKDGQDPMSRDDQQIEFAIMQRIQLALLKTLDYGMYVIGD